MIRYDSPDSYAPATPLARPPMVAQARRSDVACYVGIDPGLKGAIAAVDRRGNLLGVHDMPLTSSSKLRRPDGSAVHDVLLQLSDGDISRIHVYLERAQGMAGQGGQFNYGVGFGVLLGIFDDRAISHEFVSPAKWKASAQLGADKRAAIDAANRLFPGTPELHQVRKGRNYHPGNDVVAGRAEAILIARYGWRLSRIGVQAHIEEVA